MSWLKKYQLCKEFKKLPSELDKEDHRTVEYLFYIMSCFAEKQDQPQKMGELKAIAAKAKRGML